MAEVNATQLARRRFLTIAISSQLEEAGFSTAEKDALETLTEMMQSCKFRPGHCFGWIFVANCLPIPRFSSG